MTKQQRALGRVLQVFGVLLMIGVLVGGAPWPGAFWLVLVWAGELLGGGVCLYVGLYFIMYGGRPYLGLLFFIVGIILVSHSLYRLIDLLTDPGD